jgi:hypothetical protein
MLRPRQHNVAVGVLLLATIAVYLPSLHYGFIWDDPVWYGHVIGESLSALIAPLPAFQFYRPGALVYNAIFLSSEGTLSPTLLHAAQIGWHALNVLLLYAFVARLVHNRALALTSAALFAFHPFSHQAVAWAAPQQPVATTLQLIAWLAFLYFAQHVPRKAIFIVVSLSAFALALSIHESTLALSLIPLAAGLVVSLRNGEAPISRGWLRKHWPTLTYPALAILYLLRWLAAPRATAITEFGWHTAVANYLAQSVIYPLVGRPWGYPADTDVSPAAIGMLAAVVVVGLTLAAWYKGRAGPAMFALVWTVLGLLPTIAGLPYSYVQIGSRLAYNAVPGVALLWTAALLPRQRRMGELMLGSLLIAILLQSLWMLARFHALWEPGTALMSDMIAISRESESGQIYVNFPDRYAARRPPYPVGYWGFLVAPVVVGLSDFTALVYGSAPDSISRSAPWHDADSRLDGPYVVDMRGEITPPDALYALALDGKEVFVTRYDAHGHFALQRAGRVLVDEPSSCLVTFSDVVCLEAFEVHDEGTAYEVLLRWRSMTAAKPHDTIFLHLGEPGQPPIGQDDGNAWRGLLPLSTWASGDVIEDRRTLAAPRQLEEEVVVSVGIYNRVSGQRLRALDTHGAPLPLDAYIAPLN